MLVADGEQVSWWYTACADVAAMLAVRGCCGEHFV